MIDNYKGFNKNITKEDLDKEELVCYNKLMEGIEGASEKEKEEIAHLMDVVIEADGEEDNKCVRCGENFDDDIDEGVNFEHKRTYCNKCLIKMWGPLD